MLSAILALGAYGLYEVAAPGPLVRCLKAYLDLTKDTSPVVARVCGHAITRSQLERALREQLWLDGKSIESITPENRNGARAAALDALIDHELLRAKCDAGAGQFTVTAAEIDKRMQTFSSGFETDDAMKHAMQAQGIPTLRELRARLAAHLQQEKYVESRIGPLAAVTDAEARQWFDENKKQLVDPERVRVRHVFIATLEHPSEEAKARLDAALADLTEKRVDFATLAQEISEDPATQNNGGDLGWMTRKRLSDTFASTVFSLPLDHPALVHTKLGWHLVEVTARKPAEARSFDNAKPEILAALEAIKRHQAAGQFRKALRKFESAHIEIYQDKTGE